MIAKTQITSLTDLLQDPRKPNIVGFVDQLFQMASQVDVVGGAVSGRSGLHIYTSQKTKQRTKIKVMPLNHGAARSVLRMICARLAVVCQEFSGTEFCPYGATIDIEREIKGHKLWRVAFSNTAEKQDFRIEKRRTE